MDSITSNGTYGLHIANSTALGSSIDSVVIGGITYHFSPINVEKDIYLQIPAYSSTTVVVYVTYNPPNYYDGISIYPDSNISQYNVFTFPLGNGGTAIKDSAVFTNQAVSNKFTIAMALY